MCPEDSLFLVWRLAELEAINLNSERIDPPHFFLGLLKVVDIDLWRLLLKKGRVAEDGGVEALADSIPSLRPATIDSAFSLRRPSRSAAPKPAALASASSPDCTSTGVSSA